MRLGIREGAERLPCNKISVFFFANSALYIFIFTSTELVHIMDSSIHVFWMTGNGFTPFSKHILTANFFMLKGVNLLFCYFGSRF
jgi:hypothetical protein